MRCPAPGELARIASGELDDDHVAGCVACRAALADQRAVRELVRRAPAPPLPRPRREAIAAEVLARSYAAAERRDRPRWAMRAGLATAGLAAAIAVALLVLPRDRPRPTVARVELASLEPVSLAVRGVELEVAPPRPPPPPAVIRPGALAELTRLTLEDRDVLELRNGSVTIDARNAREVEITLRGTTVHVDHGKICVVARGGVIETVSVFAGSAEVSARGKAVVVEAGMVWVPDAVGAGPAMREFQAGWSALRGGDLRGARAAFDRARDPVVAEDAAYWAAVAAERADDRGEAARRFASFVDLFPGSPHADSARVALARVVAPSARGAGEAAPGATREPVPPSL